MLASEYGIVRRCAQQMLAFRRSPPGSKYQCSLCAVVIADGIVQQYMYSCCADQAPAYFRSSLLIHSMLKTTTSLQANSKIGSVVKVSRRRSRAQRGWSAAFNRGRSQSECSILHVKKVRRHEIESSSPASQPASTITNRRPSSLLNLLIVHPQPQRQSQPPQCHSQLPPDP
jgi:hypothetical protein